MDDDSGNLPSGGTENADPVDMISDLLEREKTPTKPAAAKPDADTGPEVDPADADPSTEADEDDADAEDAEQTDEQQEPEPELYTVKTGGQEIQVTRDELVRGYQRLSDYTRKTQEVSAARQQVEAEAQRISAERAHYSQNLEQLSTVLQSTLPPRPPLEMADTDPIGYTQANARWEASVQQLQHVFGEQQRVQQQMQQQGEAQRQQHLATAAQYLQELVPEWRDGKRAAKEKRAVAEHLRTRGYSDAEIAQAADPRAVAMALDAMRYRELVANKPAVDERLKAAPRVVKPGSGIAPPDKRKSLTQQLKRSGGNDLDIAAALIDLG
jgi:hypothetical protein